MTDTRRYSIRHVFLWPGVIGLITVIGLISALIGDNTWDTLSWVALSIPLMVILWSFRRARRMSR